MSSRKLLLWQVGLIWIGVVKADLDACAARRGFRGQQVQQRIGVT